jgi:hypothetical protein
MTVTREDEVYEIERFGNRNLKRIWQCYKKRNKTRFYGT